MPRVPKADWKPQGLTLEPAADAVVRSSASMLVVAGPGAGKTELLAQRACYLLQTGECGGERRILAISLKRDAARNLEDRVRLRCGAQLSHRFHSMTFDAFAKGLVDRFRLGIPDVYRPSTDYEVSFDVVDYKLTDLIKEVPDTFMPLSTSQRFGISGKKLYWREFLGRPLTVPIPEPKTVEEIAAAGLWQYLLRGQKESRLGFAMIGRLADLLLRENPAVLRALRASYSHVFLDEFQDTTVIHYPLVRTAFLGSDAILTAVGDNKQRVMGFAGAPKLIFGRFKEEFGAAEVPLYMNYRSTEELVRIQRVFAKAIDKKAVESTASGKLAKEKGECRMLEFDDAETEAKHVSGLIADAIKKERVDPEEICVLTRLRKPGYTQLLQQELTARGIPSRIENDLQDLLNEPLTVTVVAFLCVALRQTDPAAWTQVVGLVQDLLEGEGRKERDIEARLTQFFSELRASLDASEQWDDAEMEKLLLDIIGFLGTESFRTRFPQYRQGTFFADTIAKVAKHFTAWHAEGGWEAVLDNALGIGFVPIMTMHKSKGLEYDTVVFVGLEDGALFSFKDEAEEETCGFFVALSRAKRRAIFTFAGVRPVGRGGRDEGQSRASIGPLYELLKEAGVLPEHIES